MVKTVIWAESALSDLDNVIEYISQDSPVYAASFYEAVKSKVQSLSTFSEREEQYQNLITVKLEKFLSIDIE